MAFEPYNGKILSTNMKLRRISTMKTPNLSQHFLLPWQLGLPHKWTHMMFKTLLSAVFHCNKISRLGAAWAAMWSLPSWVIDLCSWSTVSSSCLFVFVVCVFVCLFVCCDRSGFARSKKGQLQFWFSWNHLIRAPFGWNCKHCGQSSQLVHSFINWWCCFENSKQTKQLILLLVTDWTYFLLFCFCGVQRFSQQSKCSCGEHVRI